MAAVPIYPLHGAQPGLIVSRQLAPVNRAEKAHFGPIDFDTSGANVTNNAIFTAHDVDWLIAAMVFVWTEASDATDNFGTLVLGAAGLGDTLDVDGIHAYTTLTAASTAIHKQVVVEGGAMAGAEASTRRTFGEFWGKALPVLKNGETLYLGSTKHGAGHNDGIVKGHVLLIPANHYARPGI